MSSLLDAPAPAEPRSSVLPAPGSRAALVIILLMGAGVFLPAASTPYLLDDSMQAAMARGTFVAPRGPFDLYDFVGENDRAALLERGLLPWWTAPDLTVRFLRPLSSALRWVEERALPVSPVLFHLHSLAWWVVAVLAARRLFARALGPRAAWLATCMFALGPWHALPIAWLANREALLSLALGAFGLDAYLRWREHGRARDGALGAALFGLGVLAGEYTLCFGGYVVAFEVLARREALWRRALALWPFAVPTAGYLLAHVVGGYGTRGSSFYTDPLHQPLVFLSHLGPRLASLLLQGWLTMGTHPWGTSLTDEQALLMGAGLVLVLAWPLGRALAAVEPATRATSTWLLVGSVVAMLPVLAVAPAPRLLGIPALGITATIALLLDQAWFPATPQVRQGMPELAALVATALGFAQLLHGPIASMVAAQTLRTSAAITERSVEVLAERLATQPDTHVTLVRGSGSTFFVPWGLATRGVLAARWAVLAETRHVLVLRRGDRTLELVAGEGLFPAGEVSLYRSPLQPMSAGEVVHAPGMTVTVLEVGSEGPRRARFEFDEPFDAPPALWLEDRRDGVKDAVLPTEGHGAPFDH
jgi:hypothetical protein